MNKIYNKFSGGCVPFLRKQELDWNEVVEMLLETRDIKAKIYPVIWVNGKHYTSFKDAIYFITTIGGDYWRIWDDGTRMVAKNYQPALSGLTRVELWR